MSCCLLKFEQDIKRKREVDNVLKLRCLSIKKKNFVKFRDILSNTAEYHTVSCHDYTHYRGHELTAGVGEHDPLLGSSML